MRTLSSAKYLPANESFYHLSDILFGQTAGMIVIGDEILDGSVTDTNFQIATKILGSVGITMEKVSIISDDVKQIADEVSHFIEWINE